MTAGIKKKEKNEERRQKGGSDKLGDNREWEKNIRNKFKNKAG